jgi:hypothetical protein
MLRYALNNTCRYIVQVEPLLPLYLTEDEPLPDLVIAYAPCEHQTIAKFTQLCRVVLVLVTVNKDDTIYQAELVLRNPSMADLFNAVAAGLRRKSGILSDYKLRLKHAGIANSLPENTDVAPADDRMGIDHPVDSEVDVQSPQFQS